MSDFLQRYAEIIGKERMEELKWKGETIGRIIKGRHEKGMSQEELADAVGLHKAIIIQIENGQMNIAPEILNKISKVLFF